MRLGDELWPRTITGGNPDLQPPDHRKKQPPPRDFALSRLQNLRNLLSRPERVTEARALLAEQVGKITVAPAAGERQYVAKGFVDFFGEEASRVGGGGGKEATVRLPLRFAWKAAA